MAVRDIELPNYRLSHELWNSISHGLTGVFGIIAFILMMCKIGGVYTPNGLHIAVNDPYAYVSCAIYGFAIIVCMTISCVYHALAKNNGKRVLRVLDHDFVFFLVAGTYTPYCLITLRELPLWGLSGTNWSGWLIFALVWALIALGITMNSINIKKFGGLSMVIYICAGRLIILNFLELYNALGLPGFILLLTGGISFSIGAILYGIGKKHSVWWHTVFHFFVSAGIVLQFLSVYLFVL